MIPKNRSKHLVLNLDYSKHDIYIALFSGTKKKGFNRRLIDLIDEHNKTSHFFYLIIIIKLLFFLKNFYYYPFGYCVFC